MTDPAAIFWAVFVFDWIVYIWDNYLLYRQWLIYLAPNSVPVELSDKLDSTTFEKSRRYNIDKTRFALIHGCFSQIIMTIVLLLNGLAYLWNLSGQVLFQLFQLDDKSSYEISQSLVMVVICMLISHVLEQPWSVYSTFVIEEAHGFNKQTAGFYIKDQLKKFVVSLLISLPVLALLIYIIQIGGEYFFVYAWLFLAIFSLIMVTIYADFIAPLFDKYTPLPDGELRTRIEQLAAALKFPLKKLYVVEGSKRSAHSNAYFYGFWKNKRIVLFDTLLENSPIPSSDAAKEEPAAAPDNAESTDTKTDDSASARRKTGCNNDEVIAVLGHELGHWQLNHVTYNLIIAQLNLFLCFAVFGLLINEQTIYSAFGFGSIRPIFIGLICIFQFVFSPYHQLVEFLMICLSRRNEFAADSFAAALGFAADLRSSLLKLNNDNLSFPIVDRWYSAFNYSHPPLLERLAALQQLGSAANKKQL